MLLYVTSGLVLLLFTVWKIFNFYRKSNDNYWPKRGVPLVLPSDIPGSMKVMMGKMPLHYLDIGYYNLYPDAPFVGIMESGSPALLIRDPDLVKKVLVKDFDHFVNRRTFHFGGELSDYFLANQNGNRWKNLRAAMSPTFTSGKMRRMFEHFENSANDLADFVERQKNGNQDNNINNNNDNNDNNKENQKDENIERKAKTEGTVIETREAFGRFVMDVIGSTAFGIDSQCLAKKLAPFYEQGNLLMKIDGYRGFKLFCIMLIPKLAELLKFDIMPVKPRLFFTDILRRALAARKKDFIDYYNNNNNNNNSKNVNGKGDIPSDFIQLMLEAQKAGNQKEEEAEDDFADFERDAKVQSTKKVDISDMFIIANSFSFITAGFDTTEAIMSVAAYHLAIYPEYQQRLWKEIDQVTEEFGGKITYDGVAKMSFLDMFVAECFRLYAPATRFERKVTKEYKIPATEHNPEVILPVGSHVVIPLLAFHKDPKHFPNPSTFDPERFSKENKAQRHQYVFMPFGLGPRSCIAYRFVLTKVKAAVAHLVKSYEITTCSETCIPLKLQDLQGQHRPDIGLKLALVKRK